MIVKYPSYRKVKKKVKKSKKKSKSQEKSQKVKKKVKSQKKKSKSQKKSQKVKKKSKSQKKKSKSQKKKSRKKSHVHIFSSDLPPRDYSSKYDDKRLPRLKGMDRFMQRGNTEYFIHITSRKYHPVQ